MMSGKRELLNLSWQLNIIVLRQILPELLLVAKNFMETQETPRATLKAKTKGGFTALITITKEMTQKDITDLIGRVEATDLALIEAGILPVEEKGSYKFTTKAQTPTSQTSGTPSQTTTQKPSLPKTKPCPIHGDIMYLHEKGKFGPFYSHGNKEKGYCNGTDNGNHIYETQ